MLVDEGDRIIIKSSSPISEGVYFQILNDNNDAFKISFSENYANKELVNPTLAYMSKIGSTWAGDCFVVADDRFVWFGANHAIGAFGEYQSLTIESSAVIFGSINSTRIEERVLPNMSTSGSNRCFFYNLSGQEHRLRNFNTLGYFGISTNGARSSVNYANGGQLVREVDLIKRDNGLYVMGVLPHIVYCDSFLSTGDWTPTGKKIYQSPVLSGCGSLLFQVDEL